jgi:hypothetical protein
MTFDDSFLISFGEMITTADIGDSASTQKIIRAMYKTPEGKKILQEIVDNNWGDASDTIDTAFH